MAKTNKQQNASTPRSFSEMREKFPQIRVIKTTVNQRSYITDIKLPREFTLRRKVVSACGEITLIEFSKGSRVYSFSQPLADVE